MTRSFPLIVFCALTPVFAQTNTAVLAGAGYSSPAPFLIAPGQVITLFVRDVPPDASGQLRVAQADAARPPAILAGLSVRIAQIESFAQQAPIFAVKQENECGQSGAADPACLLTSIKLQIPFEVSGDVTVTESRQAIYAPVAQIAIGVDGRAGRTFPAQPVPDNAHVLTACDNTWDTNPSTACDRLIYHLDGTPAGVNSPATWGETLKVYVYGLGVTAPKVQTGVASPSGAAVTDLFGNPRVLVPFQLNFLNTISYGPRGPVTNLTNDTTLLAVASAELVPGQIGVYQVSVVLPPAPADSYPCGGDVRSNTLLTIRTSQGTEGIGLCVQ